MKTQKAYDGARIPSQSRNSDEEGTQVTYRILEFGKLNFKGSKMIKRADVVGLRMQSENFTDFFTEFQTVCRLVEEIQEP